MACDNMQKSAHYYENMRDSGVEWLGEVPNHWNKTKISNIFSVIGSGTTPQSSIGSYYDDGTIPWVQSGDINGNKLLRTSKCITAQALKSYPALRIYKAPYIAIAMYGASVANISKVLIASCTNQACCVLASPKTGMSLDYMFYALAGAKEELLLFARGGTQPNISQDIIRHFILPVPPLAEQIQIACYLDKVCESIIKIIDEAKSSIAEYKELKSSIIYEAVTKGLNRNVEMKDSRIVWIGKIPNHWDATKIGNFVSIRSGITLGKRYASDKTMVARPYLRVANVKADRLALDDVATIMVTPEEAKKYELVPGELLMTEGGDRDKLGRGTIWNGEIPGCLHQNHVFAVHVNEKYMLTKYLDYLTTSPVGREYFDLTAKKTTNLASTNSSTILRFTVPVPPISEQKDIVAMLDTKCKILDEIIQEKEALVRDLDAYKKSLIYEVVTGKKEV